MLKIGIKATWCHTVQNLPYGVLGLQTKEETLSEGFHIVNTVEMVLLHSSCQVPW